MPVVTGFLRASILGATGTLPTGQSDNPGKVTYGRAVGQPLAVTLLKWDPNKRVPLYVGWTANYARYMEARYGFMRGAAEQWDATVAKAVKKVERSFG